MDIWLTTSEFVALANIHPKKGSEVLKNSLLHKKTWRGASLLVTKLCLVMPARQAPAWQSHLEATLLTFILLPVH